MIILITAPALLLGLEKLTTMLTNRFRKA